MKSFLEFLTEIGRSTSVKTDPWSSGSPLKDIMVHTNPGRQEVANLMTQTKRLRGLMDSNNNVHVWKAEDAVHTSVKNSLGPNVGVHHYFYVKPEGVAAQMEYGDDLWKSPNMLRAFKNKKGEIPRAQYTSDDA